MDGKNISQVSQLCGYNLLSYFISVFKEEFYGADPLHYVGSIGNDRLPNFTYYTQR